MLVILHYLIPIIIKNHFLVLGEGSTKGINDSAKAAKKINSTFSKAKTKFCLSLHYNSTNSYLYVNKTKIYKLKGHKFCLRSVSIFFLKNEQNEIY